MFNLRQNPTQLMVDREHDACELARETVVNLVKMGRRLFDAQIYDQEHAASNAHLRDQSNRLVVAANHLGPMSGQEFVELTLYRHRYARIGGARFFRQEEWDEKCSHLEDAITMLERDVQTRHDNERAIEEIRAKQLTEAAEQATVDA